MFWSSSWTIIPHLVVTSFAHAAARLAGEEYLGLLLAPHLTIASKGRWAGYMLGAPTLGEAIRRGIATIGFHSKGDVMSLVAGNGEARLSYMSAARGQTGYIHVALGSVGIVLSLCRAFLPAHWQPLRIEARHSPATEHHRLRGCLRLSGRLRCSRPLRLLQGISSEEPSAGKRHPPAAHGRRYCAGPRRLAEAEQPARCHLRTNLDAGTDRDRLDRGCGAFARH